MPELPESWGLATKKRADGKLDIIGKADNGAPYKVRTTDTGAITETDIQELKAADRESYANRETGVRQFVSGLTEWGQGREAAREAKLYDELTEAAGPVVYAGLEKKGSTTGTSRRYRQAYEQVVW